MKKISKKEQQLVDKWIKELSDAGFTYDEMIEVFRKARQLYKQKLDSEKIGAC